MLKNGQIGLSRNEPNLNVFVLLSPRRERFQ